VSASSSDAFKETAIPPLEPKYNGSTCSISTRYNWGPIVLTKTELSRRARAWGAKSGHALASAPGIASIEIGAANAFGRPRSYVVTDTTGQQYSVSSEQMRWAINADASGGPTVYSSFFRPVDGGDNIQFIEGHGHGHGVGACQWCMQARSLAGESYDQIVLRQFPQSVVMRAY
jgi:peptidoglycan hydrolase-like amidase